jgi:hypothetical protein
LATGAELKIMAGHRLKEAQVLYDNHLYSGSFYLAGYAIEFGLKSVICKRLGVDIFENDALNGQGKAAKDAAKAFQIHNIPALVLLSGLHPELEEKKLAEEAFFISWNGVSAWTEQRRYDFGCSPQTANTFLNRVKEFMQWIEKHW